MDVAWLRDLLICIFAVIAIITMIILAVLSFKTYLKLEVVLNSSKAICSNIENITACFRNEVLRPIMQLIAVIQGVRKGVESMGCFHKKEGDKDG